MGRYFVLPILDVYRRVWLWFFVLRLVVSAMNTTPRDDIAGLNERLREDIAQLVTAISQAKFSGPRTEIRVKNPSALMDDLTDAAAQLDSLLKERDALQARVKELEWANRVYSEQGEELEARALRAEQERDTLARVMEDTATELGCEPNNETILEAIVGLQQERDEAYDLAAIYIEQREGMIPDWRGFVAELRSLAAGPEKA